MPSLLDFAFRPIRQVVLWGANYLGNPARVAVDDSGNFRFLSQVHAEGHAANLFLAMHTFDAIASTASVYLELTTGATKEVHAAFGVSGSAGGHLYLYEAPTTTTGTNTVTIFNIKRTSSNTPEPTCVHTPTGISGGTLLPWGGVVPGGADKTASGGQMGNLGRSEELILKPSTKYLLQWTNDAAQAEDATLFIGFYEL